jgi:UDP-N-acetylglucosamine 2-epimerase
MKLVSIVGARPQFVKLAPLSRAIERYNREGGMPQGDEIIIHTGHHYETNMSDVVFRELDIPQATCNLEVGSASHAIQTARMLERTEKVLLEMRPDMVAIYGDTNSTVAGALAAAKLQITVVHIEAGLRSYNRRMPEEINRIVADHVSDLLLAPTPTAMANLREEGLLDKAVLTGDTMYDAVLFNRELANTRSTILRRLGLTAGKYGLVTIHRAENTDEVGRLRSLLFALNDVAASGLHLVLPMHPRTAKLSASHVSDWKPHRDLQVIDPVGYIDILCLADNAKVTLTDSGGVQREAFFLGCPCVTLRDETEWVETIRGGGNMLAGTDPEKIVAAVDAWKERFPQGKADFTSSVTASFGTGDAADNILRTILAFSEKGTLVQARSDR